MFLSTITTRRTISSNQRMYKQAQFPPILASCHIQVSLPSRIGLSTAQCQQFKGLIHLLPLTVREIDVSQIHNVRSHFHFVALQHTYQPQLTLYSQMEMQM